MELNAAYLVEEIRNLLVFLLLDGRVLLPGYPEKLFLQERVAVTSLEGEGESSP